MKKIIAIIIVFVLMVVPFSAMAENSTANKVENEPTSAKEKHFNYKVFEEYPNYSYDRFDKAWTCETIAEEDNAKFGFHIEGTYDGEITNCYIYVFNDKLNNAHGNITLIIEKSRYSFEFDNIDDGTFVIPIITDNYCILEDIIDADKVLVRITAEEDKNDLVFDGSISEIKDIITKCVGQSIIDYYDTACYQQAEADLSDKKMLIDRSVETSKDRFDYSKFEGKTFEDTRVASFKIDEFDGNWDYSISCFRETAGISFSMNGDSDSKISYLSILPFTYNDDRTEIDGTSYWLEIKADNTVFTINLINAEWHGLHGLNISPKEKRIIRAIADCNSLSFRMNNLRDTFTIDISEKELSFIKELARELINQSYENLLSESYKETLSKIENAGCSPEISQEMINQEINIDLSEYKRHNFMYDEFDGTWQTYETLRKQDGNIWMTIKVSGDQDFITEMLIVGYDENENVDDPNYYQFLIDDSVYSFDLSNVEKQYPINVLTITEKNWEMLEKLINSDEFSIRLKVGDKSIEDSFVLNKDNEFWKLLNYCVENSIYSMFSEKKKEGDKQFDKECLFSIK